MRPLRIDFEGAYQHVIVKIIDSQYTLSDELKQLFLNILHKTAQKIDVTVIVYEILDNHIHIILRSGKDGVSKFMHSLLTSFAMRYNRIKNRKGHVFESRFRSNIIEEDKYLLRAIKYVLENAVRANMVKKIQDYKWSSFNSYFKQSAVPMDNKATRAIIKIFNSKEAFYDYMEQYDTEDTIQPKTANQVCIYGSDAYRKKIHDAFLQDRRMQDVKPEHIQREDIIQFVKQEYGIKSDNFPASGSSESRSLFAFLMKKYGHFKLKEISSEIGVSISQVSRMINSCVSDLLRIELLEKKFLENITNDSSLNKHK